MRYFDDDDLHDGGILGCLNAGSVSGGPGEYIKNPPKKFKSVQQMMDELDEGGLTAKYDEDDE